MSVEAQILEFLNHNALMGRTVHLSPALYDQLPKAARRRGKLGRTPIVRDPSLPERSLDLYVEPLGD